MQMCADIQIDIYIYIYIRRLVISWIKFRVAVNLDHLLRHTILNSRLQINTAHGTEYFFPAYPE